MVEQLKADYRLIYRALYKERMMRAVVFPEGHRQRELKLAEMTEALAALERIKDLLKTHLQIDPDPKKPSGAEQPALFSVLPTERKEFQ